MKRLRSNPIIPLLVCLALGIPTSISRAEEKTATSSPTTKGLESIVFVPHDFGAPEVTDPGGVRGGFGAGIKLLAPPKLSRTMSPTPTFYWFTDRSIDAPRFTLTSDTAIEPLLELTLPPAEEAGIYSLSLAEHGLALKQACRYRWSVAIDRIDDPIAAAIVAQTVFSYEGGAAQSPKVIQPMVAATLLAEQGYWYDLIDLISEQSAAGGASSDDWHALRTRLLSENGLHDIAAAAQATIAVAR